ncbi:MAG: RNA pseudouridine synthase [Clostridia bacterium]|nr:RNA pseudouridine synthase [Clostridia bacterium]
MGVRMKILYEDNHIIAVEKPPGIPTMPDKSADQSMLDMVRLYIKEKYMKPGDVFIGLVHRLDRSTGGAMVFARTTKGASRLSRQIREKQFKKTYLAVVEGIVHDKKGKLRNFVSKDKQTNKSKVVESTEDEAREAVLNYRVVSEKGNLSLVEVKLETGRHHQIRVQFSNIGHPLWGDMKYGAKTGKGLGLWSYSVQFKKAVGDEEIVIVSEPDYCIEPWSLFR